MVFTLSGTPTQNQLIVAALDACDFAFSRIVPGMTAAIKRSTLPVVWKDLSAAAATVEPEPLHGRAGGTLGLFYYSGKIELEQTLESQPRLAKEVFLSEAAHAVDTWLLTDADRTVLARSWHPAGTDGDAWFDTGDYSTWMGEAFMGLFVDTYAPSITATIPFTHNPTPQAMAALRTILGGPSIPPTPPAPPIPPVPPVPPSGGGVPPFLDPALADRVQRAAARAGMSPEAWIVHRLQHYFRIRT